MLVLSSLKYIFTHISAREFNLGDYFQTSSSSARDFVRRARMKIENGFRFSLYRKSLPFSLARMRLILLRFLDTSSELGYLSPLSFSLSSFKTPRYTNWFRLAGKKARIKFSNFFSSFLYIIPDARGEIFTDYCVIAISRLGAPGL